MGSFYTNITLKGPDQQQVVDYLDGLGRVTFVSPTVDGFTVVYDAESESQDAQVLSGLAGDLSKGFRCPSLAVINHDDDILWYQLFVNGAPADEYDSCPNYFSGAPGPPKGGNAESICKAFGAVGSELAVDACLRKSYAFAFERHADLARGLGMPAFAAGSGFNYVAAGEVILPAHISLAMFRKTGIGRW